MDGENDLILLRHGKLEALAREAEAQRQREEDERLEYERKLERDARYAARKERKKKKKSAAERYG